MPKITPFLWFDTQAEEAANFYTSVFKNSRVGNVTPGPKGAAMVVEFQLDGTPFIALNGGPHYKFTEAVSFSVTCENQEELDYFWGKLSAGGSEGQCGWLKDKFGLSWQVVPARMGQLMRSPDPVKSRRVMDTMLKMKKIDIAALERARDDD
jgi:predicted 3-demethylubiquinone-9 3-methyltransferase (glyoxalase superfamily)